MNSAKKPYILVIGVTVMSYSHETWTNCISNFFISRHDPTFFPQHCTVFTKHVFIENICKNPILSDVIPIRSMNRILQDIIKRKSFFTNFEGIICFSLSIKSHFDEIFDNSVFKSSKLASLFNVNWRPFETIKNDQISTIVLF